MEIKQIHSFGDFFKLDFFLRKFQPLKKSYYVESFKIMRRIHFWHLKRPEMRENRGKTVGNFFITLSRSGSQRHQVRTLIHSLECWVFTHS